MTLVTIYRTFSPMDAEVVRSRLDAAQFHPVILHGLSALSMDGYSLATGGIGVQVPDDEVEDATALLKSADEPPGA